MANIAISGDTSGAITLSAPAVSGSNVQTLAAVSGTLAPIVSGTAVTASGTSVDFTGIPSWAKRVTVMFSGVSTSGTSPIQVQLGTGATPTFATSGYSSSGAVTNTGALNTVSSTAAFQLEATASTVAAASARNGSALISNLSGNTWVEQGSHNVSGAGNAVAFSGGAITLAAALTAIRITTVNGTDTFDAGSINIMYE